MRARRHVLLAGLAMVGWAAEVRAGDHCGRLSMRRCAPAVVACEPVGCATCGSGTGCLGHEKSCSDRRLIRFLGGSHRPLPVLTGPPGYWDEPAGGYGMGPMGHDGYVMGDAVAPPAGATTTTPGTGTTPPPPAGSGTGNPTPAPAATTPITNSPFLEDDGAPTSPPPPAR